MKHIKSFENNIEDDLPDNIKLTDVMWNTFYKTFNYDNNNRELGQLSIGDFTDKGTIIKRRVYLGTIYFTTEQGEFRANQFKVYTSDNYFNLQDFIKMKTDIKNYNL